MRSTPPSPQVSLDRLEEIEENVYSKCTYCKYDPKSGGGGGGGGKRNGGGGGGKRTGGGGGKRNGGAAKGAQRKSGGGGSRRGGGSKGGAGARGGGKGGGNSQYEQQIAGGQIPGEAGRDYPTFSLKQLEKKGFKGIQPAPADKVVKNYPKGGGGGGRRSGGGSRGGGSKKGGGGASKGSGGSGGSCPGSLEDCMAACPAQVRVFKVCVASCGRRCSEK